MSIQWTIVAGFLYFEVGLVLLLVLPLASPRRWQKLFRSRWLNALQSQAQFYFYLLLFMLALFLLDAVREMMKYSHSEVTDTHNIHAEMQNQMRMFRAQRNFYISGFALFLSLVIYRLVSLISSLATSQASNEAAMKQAAGASNAAKEILKQTADAGQNTANEAHEKIETALRKEISSLKEGLEKEKRNAEALKKQAEATNQEYDRLTEEYSKLQKKGEAVAASADKKDD